MAVSLPILRADQMAILSHPAQTKVVAMGRRWGKSTMAGALTVACAARGAAVAWVVPTYKNARAPWRAIEVSVSREPKAKMNRTERTVSFRGAGWAGVYSADNDVGLRGEAFDVVIVDEAAMIREETYTDVLLPTLADRDGRILLISTPKGRNWFWREWTKGKRGDNGIAAFQAPSADNPKPEIRKAAAAAQGRVSDRTYRQEWLAEFIEDGGEVFRNPRGCATISAVEEPRADGYYVAGLDWGKLNDATVLTIAEATSRRVIGAWRWQGLDYRFQIERIAHLCQQYQCVQIVAERNSMGEPLIEQMQYDHSLPVVPFLTTAMSKNEAIDGLALAFERQVIAIPSEAWLIGELEAYERVRTGSTGLGVYSAPDGMHDDGVMSLALCWHAVRWVNGGSV